MSKLIYIIGPLCPCLPSSIIMTVSEMDKKLSQEHTLAISQAAELDARRTWDNSVIIKRPFQRLVKREHLAHIDR